MSRIGKIYRQEINGCPGLGWARGLEGVMASGYRAPFGGDKNFLKFIVIMVVQL